MTPHDKPRTVATRLANLPSMREAWKGIMSIKPSNIEDEKGNICKATYRDEGWVNADYVDPIDQLKKLLPFGKK